MSLENQISSLKSLLSDKKIEETIKQTEALLKQHGDNAELLKINGTAWLAKGDSINAKYFLYRSLRFDPENTSTLATLAAMLIKQEKLVDAEEILEKILAINTTDFFALRSMGDLKLKSSYHTFALDYYEKSLQSDQFNQVSLEHQVDLLTKSLACCINVGHYNKALEIIREYPVDGFDENLFLAKRNIYLAKGDEYKTQILDCTRKLHENTAENIIYIIDLIKFLREENPVDEITQLIAKGMQLNIEGEARVILLKEAGDFYIESKKWEDAISTYKELFELENDVFYLQQLAYARENIKDYKNALMDVSKAMKLAGTASASLLAQRAGLFIKTKIYDKAITDYTNLIKLFPDDNQADAFYNLGLIYHKLEDKQNSVKMLLKADMEGHLKANEYLLKKFPQQLIKIRTKSTEKFKAQFADAKVRNLKSVILNKAFEKVWSSDIKKNIKSFEEQIPFLKLEFVENYLNKLAAEVFIITPEAILYNDGNQEPLEAFYSVDMESEHAIILNVQPVKGGEPNQMKVVINNDNLIVHYPLTNIEIPPKYFLPKDKANENQLAFFNKKSLGTPYHESVEKKVQEFIN
ncbi:MAG: hypothetical protein MK212_15625 [Saprospiraceae bacterium]|nr:hypothetical protein [Saprospiraceae bacterium]